MKTIKTIITILLTLNLITLPTSNTDDDFIYVKKPQCTQTKQTPPPTNPTADQALSTLEWTNPNSEQYKTAEKIFHYLTQTKSTSGVFAASVLGAISKEASFIPDRAESPTMCRFGMNNKTPPPCIAKQSNNMKNVGGGIYQITPWQNYTNSPYWQKIEPEGWGAINQTEYIWAHNFKNNYAATRIQWAKKYYKGATNLTTQTTQQIISTNDIEQATKAYSYLVLRGANWAFDGGYYNGKYRQGTIQARIIAAKTANNIFNKQNIAADPTKWDIGQTSQTSTTKPIPPKQQSQQTNCIPPEEKPIKYAEDGTGDRHGLTGMWKANKLPQVLKPYSLDLEKIGLTNKTCENWNIEPQVGFFLKGQCVYLSKNLFPKLWTKNGQTTENIMRGTLCNGNECAKKFQQAYEPQTPLTDEPHKGAVASTTAGSAYGHTYIVSHVFKDQSILIIEQNTPLSGANTIPPTKCDYNYRIITKNQYYGNTKFFTPKTYQLKTNTKN